MNRRQSLARRQARRKQPAAESVVPILLVFIFLALCGIGWLLLCWYSGADPRPWVVDHAKPTTRHTAQP